MSDKTVTAPQDRLIDRRSFLVRFGALAAGAIVLPTVRGRSAFALPGFDEAYATSIPSDALADPTNLTIAQAAALFRSRKLSPVELVEAYLARIERFGGIYKAFNTVLADEAIAAARAAESKRDLGPLLGIPLAIKDNYYTAGVRTTANSYIFQDFVPDFDATVVARLKAAGAIVLGKTQMGPLATTRATTPDGVVTTVNAWTPNDPSYNPGGSSTGSACAVAGRMATSSIGTQTGGSIVEPSNQQGLTGLKPTVGRTPIYGVIPLSYTRDHAGTLARDAMDAAIMIQTMAGPDPNDPRTQGLPQVPDLVRAATPLPGRLRWPTRVGVIPNYLSGSNAAARTEMLEVLESLGATIVDVSLPDDWSTFTGGAFNNVRLVERTEAFLDYLKEDVRLFGVSLNSWIQGLFIGGENFLKGQRVKFLFLKRVLDQLFTQCDVVVQTDAVPFDILGLPEIAFPIGFRPFSGNPALQVPIGTILGGPPYGEERLLSIVAAFQSVTDYHLRRPPDPVLTLAGALRAEPELRLTAEDVERETE